MAIDKLQIDNATNEDSSNSDNESLQASDTEIIRNQNESFLRQLCHFSKNMKVEPILFGLFLAVSLSDAVVINLILSRTCEVALQFNKTVCDQLGTGSNEGREVESLVQPHASLIIMIKSLISYVLPAILSIFLGPWSDLNGRRLLLLSPLFGCTIMYVMLALMAGIPNLHPLYLILASIPLALSGGYICSVAGAYCYISDITKEEDRSARLGIVDGLLFLGVLVGTVSSAYIFKAGGEYGYILIFSLCAITTAVTFVYTYFWVPETVRRSEESKGLKGLFETKLVKEMVITCFKKRQKFRRAMIFLAIFSLASAIITMEGESNVKFLYMRYRFGWTISDYTMYEAVHLLLISIGAIIGTAGLAKFLKISDAMLGVIAYFTKVSESLFYVIIPSSASYLMYVGGVVGLLGGICGPISRSILSKCVPKEELGKVFSLTSSVESLTPLAANPLYTLLYNATLHTLPAAFYLVSGSLFFINLIFFILIYCILRFEPEISYERTEDVSEA